MVELVFQKFSIAHSEPCKKVIKPVADLPLIYVPQFKLEICHFAFFNSNTLRALEDGNSMSCAV